MTIYDYIADLKKIQLTSGKDLSESMTKLTEIWSNAACKGYAIKAMRNAGLDDETIRKVGEELSYCFDEISVDEAAAISEGKTISMRTPFAPEPDADIEILKDGFVPSDGSEFYDQLEESGPGLEGPRYTTDDGIDV